VRIGERSGVVLARVIGRVRLVSADEGARGLV
jgi:hypothetical protein